MATLTRLASALARAAGANRKVNLFVERRSEPRLWCSDLVEVWVKGPKLRWRKFGSAVLEDVSPSGACIQVEAPVQQGEPVRLKHPQWAATGQVRYCVYKDEGYFVGLRLDDDLKWTEIVFRPKHLLDPNKMLKSGAAEE